MFNSDLPEAYVTVNKWSRINTHKWYLDDWAYAIREIFIEDDHVSVGAFAGACHFNGPIAYQTFYPLNPTDAQLAEARDKAERYTAKAADALLANYGAYEDAMNSLDWNEKAHYESIVDEIGALVNVMPTNDGTAADLDM